MRLWYKGYYASLPTKRRGFDYPQSHLMIEKGLLEPLVQQGLSHRKISEALGVTLDKARYWLLKHGLQTGRTHKCYLCGTTDPALFSAGRYSDCKKCRTKAQSGKYRETKAKAVDYKGGKCVRCGYNGCIAALEFHHRDPTQKDPEWRNVVKRVFGSMKDELDKCDLVCANCHREIHWDLEQTLLRV